MKTNNKINIIKNDQLHQLCLHYNLPESELTFTNANFEGVTETGILVLGDRIGTAHHKTTNGYPYILLTVKKGVPYIDPLYKNNELFKLTKEEIKKYDSLCLDYFRYFYNPLVLFNSDLKEEYKRIQQAYKLGITTVTLYNQFVYFWQELNYWLLSMNLNPDMIIWKKNALESIGINHEGICSLLAKESLDMPLLSNYIIGNSAEYMMEFEYLEDFKTTFVVLDNHTVKKEDIHSIEVLVYTSYFENQLKLALSNKVEELLQDINSKCFNFLASCKKQQ